MIHMGNNIAKIRGFKQVTQKEMASKMGMKQQEYSRVEKKQFIDDEMVDLVADILDVPAETIKTMDENISIQNIYQQSGNQGHVLNYGDSSDKIIQLYEKLLQEKDRIIAEKDQVIEMYKRQQKAS